MYFCALNIFYVFLNMQKPLILVTNDDGITAPGIRYLIDKMKELGDVVVVAPDSPQSGKGHAVTLDATMYCDPVPTTQGASKEYACSGTPADCVKIAKHEVLHGRMPDLCVSGINHGSNASINVIYSGTMSAAIEAGTEGIPAIGFSLLDPSWNADFSQARSYIKNIAEKVLANGLPKGTVLNVNIPNIKKEEIKGVKICRQARSRWIESFDKRINPQGRVYYWMTGTFVNEDKGTDTDQWALENGYISVVPIQFDLTAHQNIEPLKQWDL